MFGDHLRTSLTGRGGVVLWLVFVVIPIVSAVSRRGPALERGLVIAGAVAFVTTYMVLVVNWRRRRSQAMSAALFAVLIALATAMTLGDRPGWGFLFIYCAACAALFPPPFGLCGVVLCSVLADLHDLLGHTLSVIALKTELAGRLLPDRPGDARREIADVEEVARNALSEVRDAVSGYRRPTLDSELAGARLALSADRCRARRGRARPRGRGPPVVGGAGGHDQRDPPQRRDQCRVCVRANHSESSAEVIDNGHGPASSNGAGHGLEGLPSGLGPCTAASRPARWKPAASDSRSPSRWARWCRDSRADRRGPGHGAGRAGVAARPRAGHRVIAQVSRGDEVVPAALESRPDVALLDIEMPGSSGLDAARELANELPSCRVLILTTFGRPGYLRRAMEEGAAGFLLKDAPANQLANAIRRAVTGERIVDPGLAAAALSQGASPLTPREHEVLAASREHATVAELARALYLSPGTVRNHLSSVMQKLDARNRAEAVRVAEERGWL